MSSKGKWTPGPWESGLCGEVEVGEILIYGNNGKAIASIFYGKAQEANARLIAAAPLMVEALRACAYLPCCYENAHCSMMPPGANRPICAPCQARAALAAAEGEER